MTMSPTPALVPRLLDLRALLAKKSYFLLGPRQTGKTFWIRHSLKDTRVHDLLDSSVYLAIRVHPRPTSSSTLGGPNMAYTCRWQAECVV